MNKLLFGLIFLGIISESKSQTQASKAYTLIVGLKVINEKFYSYTYHRRYNNKGIAGVDYDCEVVQRIAEENNHDVTVLRDANATRKNILVALKEIGEKIQRDTGVVLFTFYFSGHGDSLPDLNGDEVVTKYDVALVAYDGFVVDDEINQLLLKYFTRSQNIMMVDACHSGSDYKLMMALDFMKPKSKYGFLSMSNETMAVEQQADFADCSFSNMQTINEPYNLIYFGAVDDDQSAIGTAYGGAFTSCLGKVIQDFRILRNWDQMTYQDLACKIEYELQWYHQKMVYKEIGPNVHQYTNHPPFKINNYEN